MGRSGDSLKQDRRIFGSRLPPGVRDADCECRPNPIAEMCESRLWQICGLREQEQLSSRFVELHAELMRDAILDAEDCSTARESERRREVLLGELLWGAWVRFRDRALRELRRSGDLAKR
jgi:hypothetical protein